jgi:hypothetical protein
MYGVTEAFRSMCLVMGRRGEDRIGATAIVGTDKEPFLTPHRLASHIQLADVVMQR